MSTPLRFGPELRRLRLEAGLSLKALSTALAYDKGHLSKVERGGRSPSPDLARRCDAFLGAGGELQRLVIGPEPAPAADADTTGVRPSRDPGAGGRPGGPGGGAGRPGARPAAPGRGGRAAPAGRPAAPPPQRTPAP
ncbi:helix-turn-helix domain-containing protein, partial [Streptomyces californicus]|uniref:helix-turn-helix domain-containing protein n=1 Tax=Streptomyces californicus TaxID=67351 RepID=UPI0036C266B6